MAWLPDGVKSLKVCLLVSTECTNVTDRQTDTAWRHRQRLCIASRDKNSSQDGQKSRRTIEISSVAAGFGRHGIPRPPLTLTFDRLTLKLVCESHLRWGTFLPNLGTLGLWVLKLFAMYATDGQTGRRTDGQKQFLLKKFWWYVYLFWQNSQTWRTHRETDRPTHTPHDDISRTCIASRGKNCEATRFSK